MGNLPAAKTNLPYRQSRRGWLSHNSEQQVIDAVDPNILNLIILHLDRRSLFNFLLVCKHVRIQSETSYFWSNTIPSNRKFLSWLPSVEYSALMDPKMTKSQAGSIVHCLRHDGFLVVKLGADGRKLVQDIHGALSAFWKNGPSKFRLESDDQYGEEVLRKFFHVSEFHKHFPWPGASDEHKEVIMRFNKLARDITTKLVGLVCEDYLLEEIPVCPKNSFLRLTEYPPLNENMTESGFHADVGLFAVVPCSNIGQGFEFHFSEDIATTIEIETLIEADDLLIFPGATLDLATFGRISAVSHRVKNHKTNRRQNAVFQLRADSDFVVKSADGTSMKTTRLIEMMKFTEQMKEDNAQNSHLKNRYNKGQLSDIENKVIANSMGRCIAPLFSSHYQRLVGAIPKPIDPDEFAGMQEPIFYQPNLRYDEPLFHPDDDPNYH